MNKVITIFVTFWFLVFAHTFLYMMFMFLIDLRMDQRLPLIKDFQTKRAVEEAIRIYDETHNNCYHPTMGLIKVEKNRYSLGVE